MDFYKVTPVSFDFFLVEYAGDTAEQNFKRPSFIEEQPGDRDIYIDTH